MKTSTRLAIVAVATLALLGAIYVGLSLKQPALPAPAAKEPTTPQAQYVPAAPPPKPIADETKPLTDKPKPQLPTPAAASTAPRDEFAQLKLCHNAPAQIGNLHRIIDACRFAAGVDKQYDDICKDSIAASEEKIRQLEQRAATCSAVPAQLEAEYYAKLVKAAESGDTDAQICYIGGMFRPPGGISAQAIEQYRVDATIYVQDGLARGDWRVVKLLATTANPRSASFLSTLPNGGQFEAYRMNRLLRLGASGDYAKLLDVVAAEMATKLQPDQLEQADAWSRQQYGEAFAYAPPLDAEPSTCADDIEPDSTP